MYLFLDKANRENLEAWTPGFPELQVQTNTTLSSPKVQCCLLFTSQGLEEILKDQKGSLIPHDSTLHTVLQDSISRLNMLRACVKDILGGNCSAALPSPKAPINCFERKQWSHTLLETARDYLGWLEQNFRSLLLKLAENKTEAKRSWIGFKWKTHS